MTERPRSSKVALAQVDRFAAPGGRLRDSTSRFFCTPEVLPHRPARQHLLETAANEA